MIRIKKVFWQAESINLTLLWHNGGNIQLKASESDPCSQELALHDLKNFQNSHKSPQMAKSHISTEIKSLLLRWRLPVLQRRKTSGPSPKKEINQKRKKWSIFKCYQTPRSKGEKVGKSTKVVINCSNVHFELSNHISLSHELFLRHHLANNNVWIFICEFSEVLTKENCEKLYPWRWGEALWALTKRVPWDWKAKWNVTSQSHLIIVTEKAKRHTGEMAQTKNTIRIITRWF